MEKFFDIATPEEIAKQFPTASRRPEWLEHTRASMDKDPDYNCEYLVYLYWGRGDTEKAEYYLDQIKDERRQLDVSITLYELREA